MIRRPKRGANNDVGRQGRAMSAPGMDPRHWIVEGRIKEDPTGIPVLLLAHGCFVDVELAGLDVEIAAVTGLVDVPEVEAQWLFETDGNGSIIYTGKPKPGQPCLVFIPRGDSSGPIYAKSGLVAPDHPFPAAVLERPNDLHIIAPNGQVIVLGGRAQSEILPDATLAPVARKNDEVKVDNISDAKFLAWVALVTTACNVAIPGGITPEQTPGDVTGFVSKGSSRVLVGGTAI